MTDNERNTSDSPDPPVVRISRASTESDPGVSHTVNGSHRYGGRRQPVLSNPRNVTPDTPSRGQRKPGTAPKYTHDGKPLDYIKKAWSWKHKVYPEGGLKWHVKWSSDCFPHGRVMIIDYISSEKVNQIKPQVNGKRHILIMAQEFETIEDLKKFYADSASRCHAALRLIHVQNAPWARSFLLKKFNIDDKSDLVGMESFARWARYETPRQRNGRPFPNGRSWRPQLDPWRCVSRTAFGLDYLKTYPSKSAADREGAERLDARVMHLNTYEDSSSPHGYDTSFQRMSVYVQRSLGQPGDISPEQGVENPYKHRRWRNGKAREDAKFDADQDHSAKDPALESQTCHEDGWDVDINELDNCNAIILFEQSASRKLEDCVIGPRGGFEARWRRLTFYLRKENVLEDSQLAAHCSNLILGDIYQALGSAWNDFLGAATDHVSILEDKIYENPADESRAPELWTNSSAWLKVDKIMWMHQDLIREMQSHLHEMSDDDPNEIDEDWLAGAPAEFDKLGHAVKEDLLQPTNNLNDLMYKSVGIRDSRQSLQLGLSMWRLSWITFIFLPLTFIVSFFGMNVDAFEYFPSIGWYFLAAVILLTLVLVLWYGVKHSLERKRQTAYQRGTYEQLFRELGQEYPALWSERGALSSVQPDSWTTKMKWQLLRRWFAPDRTIDRRLGSSIEDEADLGAWARLKWYLLKRWLPDVNMYRRLPDEENTGEDAGNGGRDSMSASRLATANAHKPSSPVIQELAKFSTPVLIADSEPSAVQTTEVYGLRPLNLNRLDLNRRRHSSEERPGSRASSGMMIEERNLSDSETDVEYDTSTGAEERRERRVSLAEVTEAIRHGARR
ncbi:hypothetical protein K431DRAFT_348692 [Polychaeton citri CBS 116435]|uniref:Uncharacterized protein n=1 Tax=Polychaeton citri CBS 116435 TaxID=1314669 RepID=A0A9P4Q0P9_9PEZI|nr:hypothetical protein K431DRAFT_348692 [Polychaeton citri CBS 116435]